MYNVDDRTLVLFKPFDERKEFLKDITKENIKTITELGVDYVSSGALTHSAPILDISLKHLTVIE